jgi:Flp pilus assembly protein TadG
VCAEAVSPRRAVRRIRGLLRCSSGAAAVEFAFVFPLLIMLVLGVYAVGAVMHSISSVRYALEETGRMLQMNHSLTESDLQTALNEKLENLGKQEVTLSVTLEKDAYGSDIARLTASYPYTIAVPFIPEYEGAYQQTAQVFLVINP